MHLTVAQPGLLSPRSILESADAVIPASKASCSWVILRSSRKRLSNVAKTGSGCSLTQGTCRSPRVGVQGVNA
jgi:hypothetical protein